MPRASTALFTVGRGRVETAWATRKGVKGLPRYQRGSERVDEAILGVYLSGTNTRRIKAALAQTKANLARELDEQVLPMEHVEDDLRTRWIAGRRIAHLLERATQPIPETILERLRAAARDDVRRMDSQRLGRKAST